MAREASPRELLPGVSIQWIEYMELQNMAITAAVACPYCNQNVNQYCKTASGQYAWFPHNVRRDTWRIHLMEKYGTIHGVMAL